MHITLYTFNYAHCIMHITLCTLHFTHGSIYTTNIALFTIHPNNTSIAWRVHIGWNYCENPNSTPTQPKSWGWHENGSGPPPTHHQKLKSHLFGTIFNRCQVSWGHFFMQHLSWGHNKRAVALGHLWLRNFCTPSYSMRTIHSCSKKIPVFGIHVIEAYTECE